MIEFVDPPTPNTEADVATLELELGTPLPETYRAFLLRFDGGVPSPKFQHSYRDDGEYQGRVDAFLGLHRESRYSNILPNYKALCPNIGSEKVFLPFALDPFGNLYCLGIDELNHEQVFFWDHEENSVIPVARHFPAFINNLRSN